MMKIVFLFILSIFLLKSQEFEKIMHGTFTEEYKISYNYNLDVYLLTEGTDNFNHFKNFNIQVLNDKLEPVYNLYSNFDKYIQVEDRYFNITNNYTESLYLNNSSEVSYSYILVDINTQDTSIINIPSEYKEIYRNHFFNRTSFLDYERGYVFYQVNNKLKIYNINNEVVEDVIECSVFYYDKSKSSLFYVINNEFHQYSMDNNSDIIIKYLPNNIEKNDVLIMNKYIYGIYYFFVDKPGYGEFYLYSFDNNDSLNYISNNSIEQLGNFEIVGKRVLIKTFNESSGNKIVFDMGNMKKIAFPDKNIYSLTKNGYLRKNDSHSSFEEVDWNQNVLKKININNSEIYDMFSFNDNLFYFKDYQNSHLLIKYDIKSEENINQLGGKIQNYHYNNDKIYFFNPENINDNKMYFIDLNKGSNELNIEFQLENGISRPKSYSMNSNYICMATIDFIDNEKKLNLNIYNLDSKEFNSINLEEFSLDYVKVLDISNDDKLILFYELIDKSKNNYSNITVLDLNNKILEFKPISYFRINRFNSIEAIYKLDESTNKIYLIENDRLLYEYDINNESITNFQYEWHTNIPIISLEFDDNYVYSAIGDELLLFDKHNYKLIQRIKIEIEKTKNQIGYSNIDLNYIKKLFIERNNLYVVDNYNNVYKIDINSLSVDNIYNKETCENYIEIEYYDILGNKLSRNDIYNKQIIVRYKCFESGIIKHRLEFRENK